MNKLRIYLDFIAPPDIMQMLREGTAGHELVFPEKPVCSVLAKAEPDPALATVDVAFGQPDPAAIADATKLRWIHVSTSSITRYDTPAFRALIAQRRIVVSNSASVYSEACAVHTLSFMLAQARQLPLALKTRTAGGTASWHALRRASKTIRGETALIVGYGTIGKRLAELLRPFDMKLVGYRRNPRGDEEVPIVATEQLAAALSQADHVINILPDSVQTRGFFDPSRFAAIKRGAIFYNVGRGGTVQQEALLDSLRSGHLAAAWLDVTEPEPLPEGHPLWSEPNCFITPHTAGGDRDETKTLVLHFLNNLHRFVRDEPLLNGVM
jgi:phosphoglycerate dehydrogenase-like enzyme